MKHVPYLLAILDGCGLAPAGPGNAVKLAHAPYLHELFSGTSYPMCELAASGTDVGLPAGQMGNSEVGHLNIGSGRIVFQELSRIDNAVADGAILDNEVLCSAIDGAVARGCAVHFMGLLSDGGVHSHIDHLEALMAMAADRGASHIVVHAFLDGRDVSPTSGVGFLERIGDVCERLASKHGISIRVGSVAGRYYAMDRDNRWDRVQEAWKSLVMAGVDDSVEVEADRSPADVVAASYEAGVTDEFVVPVAFAGPDGSYGNIEDGDAVVFFNFRPDRARELTRAFIQPDFEGFERAVAPDVSYVCMTEYDATFGAPIAFPKTFPENVLADVLANAHLRQYHIAETEKYAHVTFFFNGGIETPKEGERRMLIPSPKVATYDLQPEMSSVAVTDALVDAIENDEADVFIVNYANCDMVGHTGVLPAAVEAVEAVDTGLRRVMDAIADKQGCALITADHGNAEKMIAEDGTPFTAHTLSKVPFVLVDDRQDAPGYRLDTKGEARLADIAPTLLTLMKMEIPPQWTGRSLLCLA